LAISRVEALVGSVIVVVRELACFARGWLERVHGCELRGSVQCLDHRREGTLVEDCEEYRWEARDGRSCLIVRVTG
jgi:hypothetical protein